MEKQIGTDNQNNIYINVLISENTMRIIKLGENEDDGSKIIEYEEKVDENSIAKDGKNEKSSRVTQEFFESTIDQLLLLKSKEKKEESEQNKESIQSEKES